MEAQLKQQWVEALRSGKYKQTIGTLKDDFGYCCLGVLCEIKGLEINVKGNELVGCEGGGTYTTVLGPLLGQDTPGYGQLTSMNDEQNKSFLEIADYVEKNY